MRQTDSFTFKILNIFGTFIWGSHFAKRSKGTVQRHFDGLLTNSTYQSYEEFIFVLNYDLFREGTIMIISKRRWLSSRQKVYQHLEIIKLNKVITILSKIKLFEFILVLFFFFGFSLVKTYNKILQKDYNRFFLQRILRRIRATVTTKNQVKLLLLRLFLPMNQLKRNQHLKRKRSLKKRRKKKNQAFICKT